VDAETRQDGDRDQGGDRTSMEPRPYGRGDTAGISGMGSVLPRLQWSRARMDAETCRPDTRRGRRGCFNGAAPVWTRRHQMSVGYFREHFVLQWSRARMDAETKWPGSRRIWRNTLQWSRARMDAETVR